MIPAAPPVSKPANRFRRVAYPLIVFFTVLVAGAYSSGPASSERAGYTGAPSAGGGTEATCSVCHRTGSFGTPQLAASFTDMPDLAYRPGQTYTVTVSVRPEQGEPAGYGFQAQFLDDTQPILLPAGTLSEPDDATQVATLPSGRMYAEHRIPHTDSLFSFKWTAPEAGTGPVSMYLTGNLVDRAGGNAGDNGSSEPLIITLREDTSTGLEPARTEFLNVSAFPNPTHALAEVNWTARYAGQYRMELWDAAGATIFSRQAFVIPGRQSTEVDLAPYPAGPYFYRIVGPRSVATVKLRKL